MIALLKQRLPFLHRKEYLTFWLFEIILLVTLFEYFLEPFTRTYSEHRYEYWIICIFHAVEVAFAYLFTFLIIKFTSTGKQWTLDKELTYVAILLTLIGLGNFFIRDLIYDADNWRWIIFWEEMTHGWIAGALFYFLFFTLNRTIVIQLDKKRRDMSPSIIKINAQVAADSFNIEPKQIICVKADGNYAVFYISENKEVKEKMVRQTLDNIERQLVQSAGFVRSHRAYIINKHFLLKKSGNAAGLQLSLKNLPFHVPVSRSRIKDFHELTAPV